MIRQPTPSVLVFLLACTSYLRVEEVRGQTFQTTAAPAPTLPPVACSVHNGCTACVSAGCAWGIGTCFDHCDQLPEMSCYSFQSGATPTATAATSAQEICDKQQDHAFDAANCGIQTTCEACTTTQLTSVETRQGALAPTPTCSWYEDRKTCSHLECDSVGCASPYCPSSPEGQCYFGADNCNDCLALPNGCSWSGGYCELNCQADTACYAPLNFPNLGTTEICQTAANFEADTALCLGQIDCGSCTAATKTDGTNCQWYYDTFTTTGWCGMGGCDVNNLCGLTSCEGVPDNTANPTCAALEQLDPGDLTCESCLQAGCGWTTAGQCVGTCGEIADMACFEVEQFETVSAVCNEVTVAINDAAICSSKTAQGCQSCVATLKSDRRSTCQWYEIQQSFGGAATSSTAQAYCGVGGCDMLGNCGSATCGATGTATTTASNCGVLFNCQACLNNDPCVWDGTTCLAGCTAVPNGGVCYSDTNPDFAQQANFNICSQAETAAGTTGDRDVATPAPTSHAARRTILAASTAVFAWMVALL